MYKKIVSIIFWIIEIFILCGCFFIFTSTIEFFPWYEPLTMGALFGVIYLIPIQILILLIYLIRYRELPLKNKIKLIPLINEGILLLTLISVEVNQQLFYSVCILFAFIEAILLILWIKLLLIDQERLQLIK